MSTIGKVSVGVEVDGKVGFLQLSQEKLRLLVQMSASLSSNGQINIVKAPPDYVFTTLGEEVE